jgi:small GTP-binding protein
MSETQNDQVELDQKKVAKKIPLVALIGLPNSGKSTLINKIIGGNRAITDKIAHTTRDLLYGEDIWNDMKVRYVDTGGLVPKPEDKIQKMIQIKSWQAVAEADLLLWVIDRKQDPETISDSIIQRVWKTGKPVFVLINKIDDPNLEKSIAEYAKLAPDFFINVSASNGYGLGDLMDAVVNKLLEMGFDKNTTNLDGFEPFDEEVQKKGKRAKIVSRNPDGTYSITYEDQTEKQVGDIDWDNGSQVTGVHEFPSLRIKDWRSKPIKIAMLGRPNVGKSSLFNSIVGRDVQIVTEIPGTTLSVNDTLFERTLPKEKIEVKNIVFDFWGVLFFEDTAGYTKYLIEQNPDLEPKQKQIKILLQELVLLSRTENPGYAEWEANFKHLTGLNHRGPDVWGDFYTVNPKLVKFIKDNQGKYNFYFITNINEYEFKKCITQDFLTLFSGGIPSFEVNLSKPDPAIFKLLLKKFDLKAGQTVFFDDKIANIRTAQELGFETIHYHHSHDHAFLNKIQPLVEIKNLIFDFGGVIYDWSKKAVIKKTIDFIKSQKKQGKKIYFLSNILEESKEEFITKLQVKHLDNFDGGIYDLEVGVSKPDPEIYFELIDKYDLNPAESIFIDDKTENLDTAFELGMKTILFDKEKTDLNEEYEQIVNPIRIFNDPNNPITQSYLLLDTAGIRKAGQRTLGVETFATYRTVKAVNEADIVLVMFDASQPLTHQDQVVAGIASESRKGIVIILNKMDLLSDEAREKFIGDFHRKFKFLKVDRVVWVSAKQIRNLDMIWEAVDEVVESRSKFIDPNEIRTLFNYLMRKKPPQKMTDKKKPVIYDLVYTKQAPPTFELWVRFAETIHWSYTRFLANILAAQFGFTGGQVSVKIVERKSMKLSIDSKETKANNPNTGKKGSSKVKVDLKRLGGKKKELRTHTKRY